MNRRRLAKLIDTALNRYAPIVHNRSHAAFTNADAQLLADAEADIDAWTPTYTTSGSRRRAAGRVGNRTARRVRHDRRGLLARRRHPAGKHQPTERPQPE